MLKIRLALVALAVVSAIALFRDYASADDLPQQKVVAGGINVTMRIATNGIANYYSFMFVFHSSTYPVGCLSAYRDVHYELRTADKQLVPVDPQTLQHPPYEGPGVLNHVVAGSKGHPCADNAPSGEWPEFSTLSALYPNLPPGKYTLHITLTPRDVAQHADFAPVAITIQPLPSPT